jgi:hypothetical protein
MTTLGICLNTINFAPSQYAGLDFSGACVFNEVVLFAGDNGIFTHDGTSDNGTEIDAYLQLPSADVNSLHQKRYRKLIFGGYFSGVLQITIVTDENDGSSFTTKSYDGDNRTIEVPVNFTDNGSFIGFRIANVEGSDFSIDSIEAVIIPLVLKPKTTVCVGRVKSDLPTITVSASV